MKAPKASAQPDATLVAERPGHFAVPAPVGAGNVVIEAGVNLQDDEAVRNRARTIVQTLSLPTAIARIGVLRTVELRVSMEYVREMTTISPGGSGTIRREGMRGVGIGTKVAIRELDGAAPEISAIFGLGLPFGNKAFIPPSVAPSFTLGMRSALSGETSLYYSVTAAWSGAAPAANGGYAIAVTDAITPALGGFLELYGSASPGALPNHSFGAGIGLLVAPQLQLDLHGARGLSSGAPRYSVSTGLALGIPGLFPAE
jgi:hypothetical protein